MIGKFQNFEWYFLNCSVDFLIFISSIFNFYYSDTSLTQTQILTLKLTPYLIQNLTLNFKK